MAWNMDVGQASIFFPLEQFKGKCPHMHTHTHTRLIHVDVKQWNRKHTTSILHMFGLFTSSSSLLDISHGVRFYRQSRIFSRLRSSFFSIFSPLLICSEVTFSQVLFEMQFCLSILRFHTRGDSERYFSFALHCHFFPFDCNEWTFREWQHQIIGSNCCATGVECKQKQTDANCSFLVEWFVEFKALFIHSYTRAHRHMH